MTRLILLFAILNAHVCQASWPLVHFVKCKVTTADTIVTGYFTAPFEDQPDSVIARLKTDKTYFQEKVVSRLSTIELNAFTYIHHYTNSITGKQEHCIYMSAGRLLIDSKSIRKIDLIEIVNFQFVPNRVVTVIHERDIPWLTKPIVKIYQSKDVCYPYRFLVYDGKVEYEKIISELVNKPEGKESMMETLSRHKILAISLNQCD